VGNKVPLFLGKKVAVVVLKTAAGVAGRVAVIGAFTYLVWKGWR